MSGRDFFQLIYKLQSMVHRNLLLSVADRVGKLTNSTQEKFHFKQEFVNDQWQSLPPKEFSRKRCPSYLKAEGADVYIKKIQNLKKPWRNP
jgi:hypothetical protein